MPDPILFLTMQILQFGDTSHIQGWDTITSCPLTLLHFLLQLLHIDSSNKSCDPQGMNILSSDISSVPPATQCEITSILGALMLTLSTMSLSFLKFSKPFLNFFGIPSCKKVKSFMMTAGTNKNKYSMSIINTPACKYTHKNVKLLWLLYQPSKTTH